MSHATTMATMHTSGNRRTSATLRGDAKPRRQKQAAAASGRDAVMQEIKVGAEAGEECAPLRGSSVVLPGPVALKADGFSMQSGDRPQREPDGEVFPVTRDPYPLEASPARCTPGPTPH
ncbi:hypothetical protein SKAU_G00013820 [Synaphobranchus kaupii]|uniref:Uncharacterized protein n=1 Tax=Synaphobranchus kaupii TaxID=118154 RepID=A0A9Q1GBS6_SYNKA|nr:hypothetical protein SKAU_G00013820 [Synaphobranchus kaupii]